MTKKMSPRALEKVKQDFRDRADEVGEGRCCYCQRPIAEGELSGVITDAATGEELANTCIECAAERRMLQSAKTT